MTKADWSSWAVAILVTLSPAVASAQSDSKLAVGASVSTRAARDSQSRGATGIALLWRLGQGSDGWGFKYGLNWYSTELDQQIDGHPHAFGKLRVRPLMAGYGYSKRVGPARISANLLGGYAINSFAPTPTFNDTYRLLRGADRVDTDVSNGFVIRPEVNTWIDLNGRIGLNISAGYMIARPTVTVTSALGHDRRHIRADAFIVKIGAAYSVF